MNGYEKRKQKKKTNILKAALALFLEFGIQKVSVSEIAKKASVSQVTIYNYFDSKDNLIHEVMIYYIDEVWEEMLEIFDSDIPYPEKIKKFIFNKKHAASQVNKEFFHYFMTDYTYGNGDNYIEKFYTEKVIPKMVAFLNEGKENGFINRSISIEAILFYIQMFKETMERTDQIEKLIPILEDITKLFFYGIVGKEGKD